MIGSSSNFYQIGASLPVDAPSYVQRQADEEFYQKLQAGKFCYVLNSRQMGKSSLRVQTMQRLQKQGTVCAAIDLTGIGKVSQEQWYGGIVYNLSESCQLEDKFDFDWQIWWQKHQNILSPVQCLSLFIEKVLLAKIQQPIVIFVDEIDKVLSQDFSLDDFFALIRFFQNQRVDNPIFERLTFALLGVATPGDLITNKTQTPFNIGEAIELHGFQIDEVEPLIKGLQGKFNYPQGVMAEILDWTGGQPFLTQKLCKFMVEESTATLREPLRGTRQSKVESQKSDKDNSISVEEVVKSRIIENWESQDDPEHLRTIRDRILANEQRAGYLLELYQQIQQQGEVAANNSVESSELRLSGLVVKIEGKLRVYNRVYQQVFNQSWVENQLNNLRPYSEAFRAWVASGGKDESLLLRGNTLKGAEEWGKDKNLSYQDKQFLAASKEQEIQEEIAAQEQEAALERLRKDREAAEGRNQLLSEANKKAQRRISIGVVVLVVAVLGAATLGIVSSQQVQLANQAKEELKNATKETQDAKKSEQKSKENAEQARKQELIAKKNELSAQQKVKEADKKVKEAEQQAKTSKENALKSQQAVAKAQGDLDKKGRELSKTNDQLTQAQNKESKILATLKTKENELSQTSAKNEDTKAEIANVRQLVALAGQLRNQSSSDSDEALRLAALSFNIDNHELKQSLLIASQSQVYQQLEDWKNAETSIKESNQYISQVNKNELISEKGLQVQVFFYKIQGDLQVQNKQTQSAIKSYTTAFEILRDHPKDTDFTKDNQLLTGKNIESFHRGLIKLNPQDKELKKQVEASLTENLYAQLEYYLKAKNWSAADDLTSSLMLNIAQREELGWLDYEQINNFSCPNLQQIDKLWVNADKRFGFSVQKEIWIKTGNRLGIKPLEWTNKDNENYFQFARAVGWYDDKQEDTLGRSRGGFVSRDNIFRRIKEDSVYGRGFTQRYGRGGLPLYPYMPRNGKAQATLLSHCDL